MWASTFNLDQGILNNVISLMGKKALELSELDKLCVIYFDEMYVSNRIDIDKKEKQKLGPHKSCQVVMVRGLLANWKQPVYYKFDQPMNQEILLKIISQLYKAGFMVTAIVSDMGSGNMGLWKEFNVGHKKNCSFQHPEDSACQIFVFADAPHLIKLLRNHFIDQGFHLRGHILEKSCFENLINISNSDLTLAHKVTRYHLDVKGTQRQKVRPAVQLFSETVSKAIEYCGKKGQMPVGSPWNEVSAFVKLINDWFDLFNARAR